MALPYNVSQKILNDICDCICGLHYISIGSAGSDSSKPLGHLAHDCPSWAEPWCWGVAVNYFVKRVKLLWSSQKAGRYGKSGGWWMRWPRGGARSPL